LILRFKNINLCAGSKDFNELFRCWHINLLHPKTLLF